MSVGRICTREVIVIGENDGVMAAADRMRTEDVGTLVVIDPARRPVGIVTDRDITIRSIGSGMSPEDMRVHDVMSRGPRVVPETASVEDALKIMAKGGFRRLPVIDDAGALAGLVTLDDIEGRLAEEQGIVQKVLAGQLHGPADSASRLVARR